MINKLRVYFEDDKGFGSVNMIIHGSVSYSKVVLILLKEHPKAHNITWRILK